MSLGMFPHGQWVLSILKRLRICLTAEIIFGKHLNDITPFERKAAKAINFGIVFGMGPKGLVTYAMNTF